MIEIIENYVDQEFEQQVVNALPRQMRKGYGRSVIRYGSSIPYSKNVISPDIPKIFDRFKEDIEFDSVTINHYKPGELIDWHIDDYKAGPIIFVISLLNDANIDFRLNNELKSYLLPRYSLVKFSDDMRYKWEHHVRVSQERYSIVLRNSKI